MTETSKRPRYLILKQIFQLQIGIVGVGTILLGVMYRQDFGFFWHCFLLGGLGASIALQREIDKKTDQQIAFLLGDKIAVRMPVLYGALMATVTYGIFMSNLVSGSESQAKLLSSNVFPHFVLQDTACEHCIKCEECSSTDAETETTPENGVTWKTFFLMRPAGIHDLGKLFVWCFLAGYSKSFVTGLLSRLEQSGGSSSEAENDEPRRKKTSQRRRNQ